MSTAPSPLRPPLGWNSWNCFGVDVCEDEVLAAAEHLAARLLPHGWDHVVVDLGWYFPPGITTANFKQPRPEQYIDDFGRLLPAPHKFPSARSGAGFRPLGERLHAMGLKFGLHIMRGIPWQAVDRNLPVAGTDLRARDIADSDDVCPWYHGNLGLGSDEGARAYYRSLVTLYADWGVDFIKADDMSFPYHRRDIAALSRALSEASRPIMLSLSPGPTPVGEVEHLQHHAGLWRISPDFWDDWRLLHRQFGLCRAWQGRARPGAWPDADMLPIGKLRLTGPDDYSVGEMGLSADEITNEYSRFNDDEMVTVMVLWCLFRSPLFLGGFLPENDAMTDRLITHPELLGLNQFGADNREVYFDDTASIWTARNTRTGAHYYAVFNLGDGGTVPRHLPRWRDVGVEREVAAREVWLEQSSRLRPGDVATTDVPPHGVRLWRVVNATEAGE